MADEQDKAYTGEAREKMQEPIIRAIGVSLFVIAAVLYKFNIADPLEAARQHVPNVIVHGKWAFAVGGLPVIGMFMLIYGKKAAAVLKREKDSSKKLFTAMLGLTVVVGGVVYCWLDATLDSMGYKDPRYADSSTTGLEQQPAGQDQQK